MPARRYVVYDVFTDKALTGNPLAVVLDAEDLDTAGMQAIAREFNLSETTFVTKAENPRHKARLRIFTPDYEMPFAGHPTVGTAIALAALDPVDAPRIFALEENIGPVRCAVSTSGGSAFGEFDLAVMPQNLLLAADPMALGASLGLGPGEIGFENHRVGLWSAGVPYVTVPVADLAVAAKVTMHNQAWLDLAPRDADGNPVCAYVYCREAIRADNGFHARMFVPGNPCWEDPATGSAAAALAGAIVKFDRPVDGSMQTWIEQGIEMGRPSRIRLEIDTEVGAITAARIGGNAVKVAEGMLLA